MSKNERKTENVVREELRRLEFYDPAADIQVEEQKSNIDPSRSCSRREASPVGVVLGLRSSPEVAP